MCPAEFRHFAGALTKICPDLYRAARRKGIGRIGHTEQPAVRSTRVVLKGKTELRGDLLALVRYVGR